MRKILLPCFFLFFFLSNAFAQTPEHLIFFGDSLTDNGNMYQLDRHRLPKSPPYYLGRFSNGPTWAENIGQTYFDQKKTSYGIYAWGGATAISHLPKGVPITLTLELDSYLLDHLFQDKSKTLFFLWIGGNDYLLAQTEEVDALTTRVVNAVEETINSLISHHATQFAVMSLPDLGKIPLSRTPEYSSAYLHELTTTHNRKLALAIRNLQKKNPGVKIVYVDIGYYFDAMQSNPEKYNRLRHVNIQDTAHACWQGGYTLKLQNEDQPVSPEPDNFLRTLPRSPDLYEAYKVGRMAAENFTPCVHPEEYIFWDNIHPTAMAHALVSDKVREELVAAGIGPEASPPS